MSIASEIVEEARLRSEAGYDRQAAFLWCRYPNRAAISRS